MNTHHIHRIQLPNGQSLSGVAWGAWRLTESQDTSINANVARIEACLAQGITTFDHADIYGDYRCETLFGQALQAQPSLKDRIEIVTKTDIMLLSKQWPGTRVKHYDTSAALSQALAAHAQLHRTETNQPGAFLGHRLTSHHRSHSGCQHHIFFLHHRALFLRISGQFPWKHWTTRRDGPY